MIAFIKKHQYILGAIASGILVIGLLYQKNLLAFQAFNYERSNPQSTATNPFINVKINNCPTVHALIDAGAFITILSENDAHCVGGNKKGKATITFPDGASIQTTVDVGQTPVTLLSIHDVTKLYSAKFLANTFELNPITKASVAYFYNRGGRISI